MYFLKKSVLFFLIYFPVLNLCNFYDTSEGWVSDRPDRIEICGQVVLIIMM